MAEELSTTRGLRVRPEATLIEREMYYKDSARELQGLREGRSPVVRSHLEWGDSINGRALKLKSTKEI